MDSQNEYLLIPIIYARVISRTAGRTPGEVKAVLAGTGIDERSGGSQGMTLEQYGRLLKNAVTISADPTVTLRAGIDLPLTTHGDLGIATATAPTLFEALKVFNDYSEVRNRWGGSRIVAQGSVVELEVQMDEALGAQREAAVDFVFGASRAIFMAIFAPILRRISLKFARPKPRNSQLYEQLLQLPIHWGADRDSVVVPREELSAPLASAHPEEFDKALVRLQRHYSMIFKPASFTEAVTRVFTQQAGRICTIASVTDVLHVSPRTLNRKLRLENTSFQQLLDRWLAQQALGYLRDDGLTIEATAAMMGYGDEANLRRAFKRWHGMSVSRFLAVKD